MRIRMCIIDGCDRQQFSRAFCKAHYNRWWAKGDPLIGGKLQPLRRELLDFIDRAIRSESKRCIEWPFAKTTAGYPQIYMGGRMVYVTHVVLERTDRPRPSPKHMALHAAGTCHNPSCINQHHIRWGSHAENSADRAIDGTLFIGEKSQLSKLTTQQVLEIRSLRGTSTHRSIARNYGVSRATIGDILNRRSWAWL